MRSAALWGAHATRVRSPKVSSGAFSSFRRSHPFLLAHLLGCFTAAVLRAGPACGQTALCHQIHRSLVWNADNATAFIHPAGDVQIVLFIFPQLCAIVLRIVMCTL